MGRLAFRKKHLYITLVAVQILVVSNLIYSGLRMYNFVNNGNRLVHETTRYDRPTKSDQTILVLGDSLAYGVGTSSPEKSFAGQLASKFPEHNVINRAVVGDATVHLADAIENLLQKQSYDMIFIMIGGNDIFRFGTNMEETANHIMKISNVASSHANDVYLITSADFRNVSLIPWFTRSFYSTRSNQVRQAGIAADASFHNVHYVDVFDIEADIYKEIEAADGFHLNDQGVALLVDTIVSLEDELGLSSP